MTVRPVRPDEASALQALGRAAWHAAYDDLLGPVAVDATVDEWWHPGRLREAATEGEDGNSRLFLVATGDAGLLGVVDAVPDPDEASRWRVARLYVHPAHWGEGVGTRLVDAVCERLPPGVETLGLAVLAGNDVGVSFYESYGFDRVGVRTGEIGGQELEEYVYELRPEERARRGQD